LSAAEWQLSGYIAISISGLVWITFVVFIALDLPHFLVKFGGVPLKERPLWLPYGTS
jgi:hypothetical protein